MAVETELYDVLGVDPKASDSQIKKAYRKMALKWHPDKNPTNKDEAAAMFKAVSEAYEILSNPDSRRLYDKFGKDAVTGSSTPGGSRSAGFSQPGMAFHDPFELFNAFFGGGDPFQDMFASMHRHSHSAAAAGSQRAGHARSHHRSAASASASGGRSDRAQRAQRAAQRDPFDDPFFSMGGGGLGGGFGGMSAMMDAMMGGGFASMGGGGGGSTVSMMSSSSSMGGGGGGYSESVSTQTIFRGGKKITRTTRTVRHADGRVESSTQESSSDAPRGLADGGARRGGTGRMLSLDGW